MSTVGNRLIWRYCVVSEIETNFHVFSTYLSLKFVFRNFGKDCKLSFSYRNETAGTAEIYGSLTHLWICDSKGYDNL